MRPVEKLATHIPFIPFDKIEKIEGVADQILKKADAFFSGLTKTLPFVRKRKRPKVRKEKELMKIEEALENQLNPDMNHPEVIQTIAFSLLQAVQEDPSLREFFLKR